MRKLDEIIRDAASQSQKKDIYGRRQIFPMCDEEFKDLDFPQMLPILWNGDMNPPRFEYGDEVTKLRNSLLESVIKD